MRGIYKLEHDFEDDEGDILFRKTHEFCVQDNLNEVIPEIESFLTSVFGYPVELDWRTKYHPEWHRQHHEDT